MRNTFIPVRHGLSRRRFNVPSGARATPILHSPHNHHRLGWVGLAWVCFKLKRYAGDKCLTREGGSLTRGDTSAQQCSVPSSPGKALPVYCPDRPCSFTATERWKAKRTRRGVLALRAVVHRLRRFLFPDFRKRT